MLVEQERAAGFEDAPRLSHYGVSVTNHAEHKSSYYGVKAGIGEREAFAALLNNGGVPLVPLNIPTQFSDHMRVRLDEGDVGTHWIVWEVCAGAATYFQHIAPGITGGALAVRDDSALDSGVQQVVPCGKESLADGHTSPSRKLVMAATGGDVPDRFDFAVSYTNELIPAVDHDVLLSGDELELVAEL